MPRPEDIGEDLDDIELPPLDDDEDGAEPVDHDASELLGEEGTDANALDDSVAGDLDIGGELDIDDLEAALGDEGEESENVDVGALDDGLIGGEERTIGDDEQGGLVDDDDDLSRLDGNEDDGGTEGTGEPIEDEVDDAALPELDADDEGDHQGDASEEAALGLSAATGAPPPWDAVRWHVREGAGAGAPCTVVAAFAGRVLAAGDVALMIDEGAHAPRRPGVSIPGAAVDVALADGVAAVATGRGAVLLCGPDAATPLSGWRSSTGRVRLAATPGRLWILSGGALWCSPVGHGPAGPLGDRRRDVETWPTVRLDRARENTNVLGVCATGATVVALTSSASGLMVERMRSDDEGWVRVVLPAEAARRGRELRLAAAATGRAIAVCDGEAIHVSRDGGASFRKIELPGARALEFIGDLEDAPLAALVAADVTDLAYLVRIRADGEIHRLAEIEPGSGDADEVFAEADIAWDAIRELVWVACRKGLAAIGPAPKH